MSIECGGEPGDDGPLAQATIRLNRIRIGKPFDWHCQIHGMEEYPQKDQLQDPLDMYWHHRFIYHMEKKPAFRVWGLRADHESELEQMLSACQGDLSNLHRLTLFIVPGSMQQAQTVVLEGAGFTAWRLQYEPMDPDGNFIFQWDKVGIIQ